MLIGKIKIGKRGNRNSIRMEYSLKGIFYGDFTSICLNFISSGIVEIGIMNL